MKDYQKTIVSFCLAIFIPGIIGLGINALTFDHPLALIVMSGGLILYTLVWGYYQNGPLERSIGGIRNLLTSYVMPSGPSWWIPRPIGKSLLAGSVEHLELDRTREHGNHLTQVVTRNNNQVEVSYHGVYEIILFDRWARLEDKRQSVAIIMDRGVRWFVNYWDSDGRYNIASQREAFSAYLMGDEEVLVPNPDYNSDNPDAKPEFILVKSDLKSELMRVTGSSFISIKVDDVNPPETIVKAREAEAIEDAQAAKEKKDVRSIRNRIYELMWGDEVIGEDGKVDLDAVMRLKDGGKKPLMSQEEATRAVRTARGDLEDINVSGSGQDFTKGAALKRNQPRRRNR